MSEYDTAVIALLSARFDMDGAGFSAVLKSLDVDPDSEAARVVNQMAEFTMYEMISVQCVLHRLPATTEGIHEAAAHARIALLRHAPVFGGEESA